MLACGMTPSQPLHKGGPCRRGGSQAAPVTLRLSAANCRPLTTAPNLGAMFGVASTAARAVSSNSARVAPTEQKGESVSGGTRVMNAP